MRSLSHLFENNRAWSSAFGESTRTSSTGFAPAETKYLWIGCADSRVRQRDVGLLQASYLCIATSPMS